MNVPALRPLHPHQQRALEDLRCSLASGKKRPMLQAPTGFGKTLTAAHIVQGALGKGKRVAFVVPALSLIDQTVSAFEAEGIECVGVMQGCHECTDFDQPVQVCSAQTLARRKKPNVDLVIVDEAHLMFKAILKWMAEPTMARVPFIGLSATPWSKGLGKHFDHVIVAASTRQLIEAGYLAPFKAFAPSDVDLSGVSTVAGDFHEGQLGEALDRPQLVGDIVETWLRLGEGRPTICFCVNRKHAQHVCERFIEAGVAASYVDGQTLREDREAVFERFRSGETRIIVNVAVLTAGVDFPNASCIIDARPTKSRMRFVQSLGRGLRTAPGKTDCLILDHAGNHLRLGMVTDIHQDCLDDGTERQGSPRKSREPGTPLPRACPVCKALAPAGARQCPCGELFVASEVETVDGELVQLGERRSGRHEPTMAEKAAFLGELRWLGRQHGYSPGWAAHKYREKFGVWPNHPQISCAEPRPPCLETRDWLKSRQIAWVKQRRAG